MSDQTAWQAKGFRHKLSMILEYTTMFGITVDHQFGLLNGSGRCVRHVRPALCPGGQLA